MSILTHADVIAMMEPIGRIAVEGGRVVVAIDTADDRPAVYAWVVGQEVIYIGKAGRGLKRRAAQWQQGFRGTGRGGAQAARLIERGKSVTWMAMWPEDVAFRGTMIPSHSSVEDWLIEVTTPRPERNR